MPHWLGIVDGMDNLAEAFLAEQTRCRELLADYRSLPNNAGAMGGMFIANMLQRADRAAMEGDVVAMLRIYQEMQESE